MDILLFNQVKKILFSNIQLILILFLLTGCCYTFREVGSLEGKSLYIKPLENLTSEPNLDSQFSRMVIDELAKSFRLVESEGRADLILSGRIIQADEEVSAYTETEQPTEYRYFIKFRLELRDNRDEIIIDKQIEGWGYYDAQNGIRDEAIETALDLLLSNLSDLIRSI